MRAYLTGGLITILAVTGTVAHGADKFFPELAYDPSSGPTRVFTENQRRLILDALSSPDRDRLLDEILKRDIIGEEKWYDLRGLELRNDDITAKANFIRICLDYARFDDLNLAGANFNGALLRHATFHRVNLENATLADAHLEAADFLECKLNSATMLGTAFSSKTKFRDCDLAAARFGHAHTTARSSERVEHPSGVEFSGGNLKGVSFQEATLINAEFVSTDLSDSDFTNADLTGATFLSTVINGCDFTDAILVQTDLSKAKLTNNLRLVRTTLGAPKLGDLDISKIDTTYVKWQNQDYRIWEEIEADNTLRMDQESESARLSAAESYGKAENIYRSLAQRYRSSGYLEEYLALRERSMEARRKVLGLAGSGALLDERTLLNIGRVVDKHGTSLGRFLVSLGTTIAAFTLLFAFLFFRWSESFAWYITHPDSNELAVDSQGAHRQTRSPFANSPPAETSVFKRMQVSLMVGLHLSIEALFRFVQPLLDIPNLTHAFRKHDVRAVPRSLPTRLIYGLGGVCGVVFLYYGSKMILLMVGSL